MAVQIKLKIDIGIYVYFGKYFTHQNDESMKNVLQWTDGHGVFLLKFSIKVLAMNIFLLRHCIWVSDFQCID